MKKFKPVFLAVFLLSLYSAQAEEWCANNSSSHNICPIISNNTIPFDATSFEDIANENSSSRKTHWRSIAELIIADLKNADATLKYDNNIKVNFASSSLPNAFVNKKHLVTISAGLLESIDTSDELTFVIAHELSHIILGHTQRPPESNMNALISEEISADEMAMKLMAMTKNPKISGAELLTRLGNTRLPHNRAKRLIDTHPSLKARIAMLAKNN